MIARILHFDGSYNPQQMEHARSALQDLDVYKRQDRGIPIHLYVYSVQPCPYQCTVGVSARQEAA